MPKCEASIHTGSATASTASKTAAALVRLLATDNGGGRKFTVAPQENVGKVSELVTDRPKMSISALGGRNRPKADRAPPQRQRPPGSQKRAAGEGAADRQGKRRSDGAALRRLGGENGQRMRLRSAKSGLGRLKTSGSARRAAGAETIGRASAIRSQSTSGAWLGSC